MSGYSAAWCGAQPTLRALTLTPKQWVMALYVVISPGGIRLTISQTASKKCVVVSIGRLTSVIAQWSFSGCDGGWKAHRRGETNAWLDLV